MDPETLFDRLGITPADLTQFCQTAQIIELALFGSILRDDFRPDSDIDILVTFSPDCKIDLMQFVQLEYDLEDWLQRDVDLVSKRAVENDRNWIRRQEILNHHQIIVTAHGGRVQAQNHLGGDLVTGSLTPGDGSIS
jgi:uncharacterized protein